MTHTVRGLLLGVAMLGMAFLIVEGIASNLENRHLPPTEASNP
jgi:hypothetical protein